MCVWLQTRVLCSPWRQGPGTSIQDRWTRTFVSWHACQRCPVPGGVQCSQPGASSLDIKEIPDPGGETGGCRRGGTPQYLWGVFCESSVCCFSFWRYCSKKFFITSELQRLHPHNRNNVRETRGVHSVAFQRGNICDLRRSSVASLLPLCAGWMRE